MSSTPPAAKPSGRTAFAENIMCRAPDELKNGLIWLFDTDVNQLAAFLRSGPLGGRTKLLYACAKAVHEPPNRPPGDDASTKESGAANASAAESTEQVPSVAVSGYSGDFCIRSGGGCYILGDCGPTAWHGRCIDDYDSRCIGWCIGGYITLRARVSAHLPRYIGRPEDEMQGEHQTGWTTLHFERFAHSAAVMQVKLPRALIAFVGSGLSLALFAIRAFIQVHLYIMDGDSSEEEIRRAELSACRWSIPSLSDQDSPPTASRPTGEVPLALGPPDRIIEVGVHIHGEALCFFDIASWRCLRDLLEACEDPGCSNETTNYRVSHITVHITPIALGCQLRPPDFITPPSSHDEM
ncbi:hypothetical protein AK812_SmicGene7613 [Symbiodinium microadriaticum]|uniref:Uncharacterized protein n=1 Tax=Symbiodinium microadriaticum TaxID=2951 RepID=A0A1Q9EN64_SYMMI|nr:hypothetical protein AK812_SmicGene7613 [Symbiodinium microadriaticum]